MSTTETARVFKAIRRIVRAVDLRSKEVMRATGLTIPQIVILQGVHDLGQVTTKALSHHVDLSSPTVVTILEKLEDRQLIRRFRSRTDRRVVHAELTAQGAAALERAPDLLQDEFRKRFAELDRSSRAELCVALETVAEMMNAPSADTASILAAEQLPS